MNLCLKNWRIVKIATTKAQRKLFFNLRKLAKNRAWLSSTEVETVASELSVSTKDVRKWKNVSAIMMNLSKVLIATKNPEAIESPEYYLEDFNYSPAALIRKTQLGRSDDMILCIKR